MIPKQVKILVTGKVQGVFFRQSAKKVADKLGIKGYAKNLPSGEVLIKAEGDSDKLKEFIEWCKNGPPSSSVSGVKVEQSNNVNKFNDFDIM